MWSMFGGTVVSETQSTSPVPTAALRWENDCKAMREAGWKPGDRITLIDLGRCGDSYVTKLIRGWNLGVGGVEFEIANDDLRISFRERPLRGALSLPPPSAADSPPPPRAS